MLQQLTNILVTSSAPGNLTVAHGLSTIPTAVSVQMETSGQMWLQFANPYDSTNNYLTASDTSLTANVLIFSPAS